MVRRYEGYTLVELVVVILIFGIVMTLISQSFNRIVANSGQMVKSAETDIGGLIGLEVLRIDLGLAGFGLPWYIGSAQYDGESESHLVNGNADTDAASFNDASSDGPPRAFVLQNDKGVNGSDYLVLKGTALGMDITTRRWSYLNYSSTGAIIKPAKSEVELAYGNGDLAIVLNSVVRGGSVVRDLVTDSSNFSVKFNYPIPDAFAPKSKQDSYLVYGIMHAPQSKSDPSVISFPFNRADYYLGIPSPPQPNCAHGTGSLYRGQVSQNGNFTPFPILDCVADLQVVFLTDTSNDGTLVPNTDISGFDAKYLRENVKEVRVYILAQQGKKDPTYSYPVTDPNQAIVVGYQANGKASDPVSGRVWTQSDLASTFNSDWLNYHWKVYTIAVQTTNLY